MPISSLSKWIFWTFLKNILLFLFYCGNSGLQHYDSKAQTPASAPCSQPRHLQPLTTVSSFFVFPFPYPSGSFSSIVKISRVCCSFWFCLGLCFISMFNIHLKLPGIYLSPNLFHLALSSLTTSKFLQMANTHFFLFSSWVVLHCVYIFHFVLIHSLFLGHLDIFFNLTCK